MQAQMAGEESGIAAAVMGGRAVDDESDERDFIAMLMTVRPEDRDSVLLQIHNAVKKHTVMIV